MNHPLVANIRMTWEDTLLEPLWKVGLYCYLAGACLCVVYKSVPWIAGHI